MPNYINADAKYWLAAEVEYKNKSLIVRGVDFELVKEMLAGTPAGVYSHVWSYEIQTVHCGAKY